MGCARHLYTSPKYFDCSSANYDISKTDTSQIIYQTLAYACIEKKDIPDFTLLKDTNKIYIANILFKSPFSYQDTTNYSKFRTLTSIPSEIGHVFFCLKSFSELRHIADKAGRFVYIQLGHITINNDEASIGISTNWMLPGKSKRLMLSGGGYIAKLKKIDGKWTITGKSNDWVS